MRSLRAFALTAASVVLLASCEREEQFRTQVVREWRADQVTEINLRGINGQVKVQPDASGKVSLIADIRATGRPAQRAIERGLIEVGLRSGTLDIKEKIVSKKVIELVPLFKTGRIRVNYLLKVPETMNLHIRTLNGRIESAGVSGFLELETINGTIGVKTPRGQLEAKTVNGSIRAEFVDEFRGAQVKTVNGSIRLSVPAMASLDAQIDQVNGTFRTNIPVNVSASPGHRESSGSINGGEFPLEISTVNGSVSLERREEVALPDSVELTLSR